MSRKTYINIVACLLSLFPLLIQAQSLTEYEYWFDDDFSGRHSGSVSGSEAVVKTSVDASQLDNGVHKFSFRVMQSDGKYSAISSSLFLKRKAAPSSIMEYWFDDKFDQRESISLSNTEDEQEFELDLRDNTKFPIGFHKLNMRITLEGESESAVYSSPVLKLSAGTATALEYWIDDDRTKVHTINGKLASDGKDYIFASDLDLGDVSPGYHRLYCRAVSNSKRTASAVTMTPIIVKSRYYHENKMIQYTIAVDDGEPVTYPIKNSAKEVILTHTIDTEKLSNGKHYAEMSFWNSSYNSVTDTFSFNTNSLGQKLATPIPSTFKGTNITPSGFTASWDEVEGALYYDILVKHEGGDYEHPDYRGGSSGTSLDVTGLEPFTSYYFQIRARNDNGNEASDWSQSIPNAVKTARIPTATADLAIHSIQGFNGLETLTKGHSYHYKVWIVNNGNSVWNGSFYLKDGDDDIKGWYQISIPKTSAQPLECDYVPDGSGTKELVLYYQTNGTGGGIPVNMTDNTPNKMVVQVVEEPTYNEGIMLSKAIICPTTSQIGNTVDLSASVINNESDNWSGTLYLVDNGITLTDNTITMKPGKGKVLSASWTPETKGIHEIAVYYKSENGYDWQLVSGNGYANPVSVEVSGGDALTNATFANITHVTKDVVPSEVTMGSTVYYYFRLTDDNGNRLKGIRIRFECTESGIIVETTPSDENGIAVLEIKTDGSAAIAARGETVKMVCKVLLNENNDNVQFAYQQSDGEIELTIHQGTTTSIKSGFENVDKMKFTLDLGLSAKAGLGNYVKAKGGVSFPLSLSMKFDDSGGFKDYTYDAKVKGSLSGSVGNYDDEYYSQNFGTSSSVIQGSVGVSGGFHYNFSSNDWRDIFVRFIMAWCDSYFKVTDWKQDLAIKTLESWYGSKRDWKETTNWFVGGEVGASVDCLNVVEIPSFLQKTNKMPLMSFPDLGLGGKVSFNLDCKIEKKDNNRTLIGDGASYTMKGEFKAQEKVKNLFSDAKLWWYTTVKHKFLDQLSNFYLDAPMKNLSHAFSVKSEELFDKKTGDLKEVSHEMSLEDSWELSFKSLPIPWNPLDAEDAKIGVTSTSTSKFVSKEDWATYVGNIVKSSPDSQESKYVYSLYPNLKYTTLFTTPGEIYSFWMLPPEGALNKLMSKASDPSKFKLKDALKVEQTLSSDLTMGVKIPIFDWKALKFSIDVGATLGLYNKPTVSYYSVEDKSFFPLSVHPTTSIYRITGWLLDELAKKLGSIFDNDEQEIVKYIPMDDAYGTGLVLGEKTRLIVPGLPQYDESVDPTYPYFLDDEQGINNGAVGDGGDSFVPRHRSSIVQGLTHYQLDKFDNSYAKYVISRHPRLGERIQRDICTFAFNFNDGTQNFDEGVIIKIPHYYPAGDLFAVTDTGDTLFVVSEVCNVIAQNGDSVFNKTQQGEFEVIGYVGADDLTPFGFPENQPLDVYYCADGSEIWQYVGPAGTPLKVDKLGAYMMATSIKKDIEAPMITATLNENSGLMHINVTDNIGVRVSSLKVYVNSERKEVAMINESNFELQLSEEEMRKKFVIDISVKDLADNEGRLFQIFNIKEIIKGDVNGDGSVSVTDVTMVISHILGQTPEGFNKIVADINGDGSITITDVTMIINIILTGGSRPAITNSYYADWTQPGAGIVGTIVNKQYPAIGMNVWADDGIKVSPLTIAQGETADLEIMFESAEAKYVGYQFDVTAEGVGFDIDLDEEEGYDGGSALAKSHTIAASEPTPGTYRFLCSSNKNATIKAGSNVLMTISLKADAELEPGTYKVTISNIEFSDGKSPYKFDPVEATVTVTIPTAIKSISASKQKKATYNVAGQQVEMQKGINIVEGKKVMVK